MLPAVTSIPKPEGHESRLIFYCGCGKPYPKQYLMELHQ